MVLQDEVPRVSPWSCIRSLVSVGREAGCVASHWGSPGVLGGQVGRGGLGGLSGDSTGMAAMQVRTCERDIAVSMSSLTKVHTCCRSWALQPVEVRSSLMASSKESSGIPVSTGRGAGGAATRCGDPVVPQVEVVLGVWVMGVLGGHGALGLALGVSSGLKLEQVRTCVEVNTVSSISDTIVHTC